MSAYISSGEVSMDYYIDDDGNLVLNGDIQINTDNGDASSINDLADLTRFDDRIDSKIEDSATEIRTEIANVGNRAQAYTNEQLNGYKAEVGQYMTFNEEGLKIGATSGSFSTVIDNRRMAFMDNNNVVAYISNKQLYIPDAVIQKSLWLGGYAFVPHEDGSVSLIWQGIS